MIGLKRVLVAVDFSECGESALRYGCELVSKFDAELLLLHVLITPLVVDDGMDFLVQTWQEHQADLRAAAEHKLKELEVSPMAADKVTVATRMGAPFSEITQFAEAQGVDLIVMGTHGRTGLRQMVMGSVAERVVRKAACPVLTVQHSAQECTRLQPA